MMFLAELYIKLRSSAKGVQKKGVFDIGAAKPCRAPLTAAEEGMHLSE
jgi:hypothetical protein